jgi:cytidylate kinase
MKPRTIALDGTAASGKSTIGCELARRLGYLYLDTGVMYRAATWAALNAGIDVADEEAVSEATEAMLLEILPPTIDDGRQVTVLVNGADVTWLIRSPEVNANVSQVSCYRRVRQILTEQQRQLARKGPVVMAGRDIGTVVLPDADLKIFTVASVEERARRRYQECLERGETVDYDQVLASVERRDKMDRENPVSPMVPAPDAIVIDTDNLSKKEVLQKIESLIERENASKTNLKTTDSRHRPSDVQTGVDGGYLGQSECERPRDRSGVHQSQRNGLRGHSGR